MRNVASCGRGWKIGFALWLLMVGGASWAQHPSAPPEGQLGMEPTASAQPTPAAPYSGVWQPKTYKVPAANIVRVKGNRVYPHPNIPQLFELVAVEGDEAIIRQIPPEDPDSPLHRAWLRAVGQEALWVAQREYLKDKFLVQDLPEPPEHFTDRIRFKEIPGNFPRGGQWQMSFDVADMNKDGRLDLILPPARGGEPWPSILLQQADGSFRVAQAKYDPGVRLDYGAVRVADFDGDGNLDLALACHFTRSWVLYNDGKLNFVRAQMLPEAVRGVTFRSLTVGDFNGDKRPDLAALAELDISLKDQTRYGAGLVTVWLNEPSGWRATTSDSFNKGIMGDWLASGDINRDGLDDLFLTSRGQGVVDLVFLADKGGSDFRKIASLKMPINGFVFANALGVFDGTKARDLVLCFEQFNPKVQEDPTQSCGIYHFHDSRGKFIEDPTIQLLFKEKAPFKNYNAVAAGDVDGDGRDDVVVGNELGEVRLFLQLSPGSFYEQKPGLSVKGPVVDLKVRDLNGDGLGDPVVMSTTGGSVTNGGVWAFLSEKSSGTTRAQAK